MDLDLKRVLASAPRKREPEEPAPLLTPWGEALDPEHVLQEHPSPQFARENVRMLNGWWDYAIVPCGKSGSGEASPEASNEAPSETLPEADARGTSTCGIDACGISTAHAWRSATPPSQFDGRILVPFSPEALLSGVGRQLQPDELLWYRRGFTPPVLEGGKRLLLHFQAVDHTCSVRVNGAAVGTHAGGYLPFAFDITDHLVAGENELAVCVADPSEFGNTLRGKQRFDRGDIWYTAQSGIWQTVWMEVVPAAHIASVKIEPDAHTGILAIGARLVNPTGTTTFTATVCDADGALIASGSCEADSPTCAVALRIPDARLWSPADPYLYQLRFTFGDDEVASYCAFRSVEMKRDAKGAPRVFLNGEPLFIKGVLDQAYWSDGLMTAPADEALVHDIEAMRDAGFNLMRKHIKVESARWYHHCDRLGMLVLQDMVSGGDADIHSWQWSYKPTLFKMSWAHYRDDRPAHQLELGAGDGRYRKEWTAASRGVIETLGNHPCIIGWSLFNEGWGQFDAKKACEMARRLDPSRVIDAVSGWYDQGVGDFKSQHNYFRDLRVWPDHKGRAYFVSEFGGYTHRVDGHSSLDEAYGYEPFDDIDKWRTVVRQALAHMDALEAKGLAGYVYTQVSDIEEETNGILTYDRRVNKLQ